jgi:hypothetical protein
VINYCEQHCNVDSAVNSDCTKQSRIHVLDSKGMRQAVIRKDASTQTVMILYDITYVNKLEHILYT